MVLVLLEVSLVPYLLKLPLVPLEVREHFRLLLPGKAYSKFVLNGAANLRERDSPRLLAALVDLALCLLEVAVPLVVRCLIALLACLVDELRLLCRVEAHDPVVVLLHARL